MVGVLALAAVYYVALFAYVGKTVQREDVLRLDGPRIATPDLQQEAQNYLLVSAGAGAQDTTMLAHLSPDRSRVVVVSFPTRNRRRARPGTPTPPWES